VCSSDLVGGERFAFSILVNDWTGRSSPVVSSIDRLGGLLASVGAPESASREALAGLAAVELPPAEERARIATYAAMAQRAEKKNLAALRTALRVEHDPLVRAMAADALYRSDPDSGGGALLEAMPPSADLFARLRSVTRDLALPIPAISSLLDLAVDGSSEAFARLLAFAPLAIAPQRDDALFTALSDGLVEVADASPDEFVAAVRAAPADQSQALIELLAEGISRADLEPDDTPVAQILRSANPAEVPQAAAWLAVLEQRSVAPPAVAAAPEAVPPAPMSVPQSLPVSSASLAPTPQVSPREAAAAAQATAAVLEAAAAAKAATSAVPAAFSPPSPDGERWPTTTIPNPAWPGTAQAPTPGALPVGASQAPATAPAPAAPAASTAPQAPEMAPACTPEPQSCAARPPEASRPGG